MFLDGNDVLWVTSRDAACEESGMALRNGNASDRASVLSKIGAFNKANPELAITSSGLQQSIKNRARYSARAEAGIVLNPTLEARLNKAVTE
ncbi:hypothetical protein [Stenotrophomonas maltophilia]|uniref:hypothetical protein n=1 Tax=Stenotrophomonas maltophilia TaxID=40324 RepID=UPI000A42EBE2|nr:hypothetical protein [Stenotrophomonas maltophilia]